MTDDVVPGPARYEPPTLTPLGALALTFGSLADGADANGLGPQQ